MARHANAELVSPRAAKSKVTKAFLPTPVKYDATPGGPGNHYRGLGYLGKHDPAALSDANVVGLERQQQAGPATGTVDRPGDWSHPGWWASEPRICRVADGVPFRVERLSALGNAQVPIVAAAAWRLLT